jgi:glucose/arabinose dehydrogenase
MIHHLRVTFLLAAALLAIGLQQTFAISPRVANTTLRMPGTASTSATYATTNAFGNLAFTRPVGIVTPPGENRRLFIIEQGGRLAVITNLASPTRTVFMDLTDRVDGAGSERGLLALAFHPNFAVNRYFYVWYTTPGTPYNRLSRFEVDPNNPNRGLSNTEQILINQRDEADNHNGGELLFGPDGYLYLSIGDEGHSVFVNNFQRIDRDFFSCILRIDVDKRPGSLAPNRHPANDVNGNGTFNYAVPPDNPFVGATTFNGLSVNPSSVRTEFWAAGLRNPWRMAFDSATGLLYCADVGQTEWEEVNIITKGGNYGWVYREGYEVDNGFGRPPAGFNPVDPIFVYGHGSGPTQGNSITGGIIYRGDRFSDLFGGYLFADYISGNVWVLHYEGSGTNTTVTRLAGNTGISSFGLDPSTGDILLADHFQHRIKRLVRTSSSSPAVPATLAETGAFSDLTTLTPHPGISEYDINVPFWSDHGKKTRWFSIPDPTPRIGFQPTANWTFPEGTVWIKHFDLELTKGNPSSAKRIETRFIVKTDSGAYGVTYRWGDSMNNATLVPEGGMDESFIINDGGTTRTQVWRYPSRGECMICHTPNAGFALGFGSAQLNKHAPYNGGMANQITALGQAGYLDTVVTDTSTLPKLSLATDTTVSLEHRARSYLAANCVQCHYQGGTAQGFWDARIHIPLENAGIINGALIDQMGNTNNRVVRPGYVTNSVLYTRVAEFGQKHMPPLATSVRNDEALTLLSQWITSLSPPQRPSPPRALRVVP